MLQEINSNENGLVTSKIDKPIRDLSKFQKQFNAVQT